MGRVMQEAPTGIMAIAAAEVVAALKGKPASELPSEVAAWVKTHEPTVGSDLLKKRGAPF